MTIWLTTSDLIKIYPQRDNLLVPRLGKKPANNTDGWGYKIVTVLALLLPPR
jgi:hypothetical protein